MPENNNPAPIPRESIESIADSLVDICQLLDTLQKSLYAKLEDIRREVEGVKGRIR